MEHTSEAPFRFITNRPPVGAMQSPGFKAGMKQIARRGLTFDAAVFETQLADVGRLAAAFPDTTIVLNHAGQIMALEMGEARRKELFHSWRDGMRALARHENVVVKIGGFGLPCWNFGFTERVSTVGYLELAAAWQPYVEVAVEAFGAGRCMMESNFPQDGRSCGFVPLWNALKHITRGASREERNAMFHGTALRVYRLDVPALVAA
jgi:predicted TIM-barrel fold metal-dependent hydrolase